MNKVPAFLRPYFWDVDFGALDPFRDRRFISERLMAKTTPETYHWLRDNFGDAELHGVAETSRRLEERDRRFWLLLLDPARSAHN
jgi:hypothetical protein